MILSSSWGLKRIESDHLSVIFLSSILFLTGCQGGSINQTSIGTTTGAVLGAVTGGLLGNSLGGRATMILAAVGGAAAGAWIGNEIAHYLDERGREELARSTQVTAVTGTPQTWRNPETGGTVKTKVTQTKTSNENIAIPVLKGRVTEVPPLDLIGAPYRAKRNTKVRGGPGTDYAPSGDLTAGQAVAVVGKVQNSAWYMVSENGAGSGFVATELLERLPPEKAPVTEPPNGAAVETVQVEAARTCRTIEQTITTPEGPKSETVTACQGPNGWEVI